jgi:hypothetical protein
MQVSNVAGAPGRLTRRALACLVALSALGTLASASAQGATSKVSEAASWVAPNARSGCPSSACSQVLRAVAAATRMREVPPDLTPSLADTAKDILFPPDMPDCGAGVAGVTQPTCLPDGSSRSPARLVLLGDSEAQTWSIALDAIARRTGYTFLGLAKTECTMADLDTLIPYDNRPYTECPAFRRYAIARINRFDPRVVVISTLAEQFYDLAGRKISPAQYTSALVETIKALSRPGRRVFVVADPPYQPVDPPICLAAREHDMQLCETTLAGSWSDDGVWEQALRTAAAKGGASFVDVYPWFCSGDTCPLVVDGTEVYLDYGHMTSTYGVFLAGVMQDALGISNVCGGRSRCNSYPAVPRDTYYTDPELKVLSNS